MRRLFYKFRIWQLRNRLFQVQLKQDMGKINNEEYQIELKLLQAQLLKLNFKLTNIS